MIELELVRTPTDRKLYRLDGIGTLRFAGAFSRTATAASDGNSWRFTRRGFWRQVIHAADAADVVVGEFVPRGVRRGGTLRWGERRLTLRATGLVRERYVLVDGDRALARIDAKSWGSRPVMVAFDVAHVVEPGLVLFASFVVHQLAADAANVTAAGATAAVAAASCG